VGHEEATVTELDFVLGTRQSWSAAVVESDDELTVDELTVDIGDDGATLPWQEQALCAQTDPEAFFPEKGGSTREAKRVCGRCDVRGDCLSFALAHDERFGIWGGLSERERRRLKRRAV
jgi:WhiB family redox-sensing transcriptional regulator